MRGAAATFLLLALTVAPLRAQDDAAPQQPSLAAQLSSMLHRESDGHSPTPEEIQTVEGLPGVTDPAAANALVPLLTKALGDSDQSIRAYALAMLVGMQALPDPPAAPAAASSDAAAPAAPPPAQGGTAAILAASGPAVYKPEVTKALLPLIPAIAAKLTDDSTDNRGLAATVLTGFGANAPASVFAALTGFLRRDDAASSTGVSVVSALLQMGTPSAETATAIARFLGRPDLNTDLKADLVETITGKPNQNQAVDKALTGYLDADDAGLRSRVILSLPKLDLSPDTFAAVKARVANIADGGQDALPVVTAAKSVTGCWTQVRMPSGCPLN
jgi:hypothetical protein